MEADSLLRSRLPVVPAPAADERLSSWLARLAALYGVTVGGLLEHLGIGVRPSSSDFIGDLEWRLGAREAAAIVAATGQSLDALRAMTFAELRSPARALIARRGRRICPACAENPAVERKSEALPWVFWCPRHGARMRPPHGPALEDHLSCEALARLDPLARLGAARLGAWVSEEGDDDASAAPSLVSLLDFLTASYRRSSPPKLAEIPGATFRERRFHEALSCPVPRQTLLVVVPEYDRAAPVFAKAVASGLSALARGSLLQTYALAVGLGRLSDAPVAEAVKPLAASDAEGEARLCGILRSWPAPLRRRIEAERRKQTAAPARTAPRAVGLALHGRPGSARDEVWRRLATDLVAENAELLAGLGAEAKIGALMRLAEARKHAPVSKTPAQSH